jgi:hypothetical protein
MYERISKEFPERVVMVNCTENGALLSIEEIAEKVWMATKPFID